MRAAPGWPTRSIVHRLPETLESLELGDVDGFRVRLLVQGTRVLDRHAARQVQDALLHRLAGMTPRAVERRVAEEAALADPVAAEERRSEARTAREVVVGESRDGVRDLWARLDAGSATRLDARVDQVADWLGELGDTDPKVMRRATALGLLADPAVVESLWRQIKAGRCGRSSTSTTWSTNRRQAATSPSESLAEAVRLAFETEVFPWGTAPARRCDLDHQVPWPIGPDEADQPRAAGPRSPPPQDPGSLDGGPNGAGSARVDQSDRAPVPGRPARHQAAPAVADAQVRGLMG